MSKYYYLISGLPAISPDDVKLTYSVPDFKTELENYLSKGDRRLMRWFYLKFDNRNLLLHLKGASEDSFDDRGNFSASDIKELVDSLKQENRVPKRSSFPAYFIKFTRDYLAGLEAEESTESLIPEDGLSALYYEEAMKCGNKFFAAWFEMNLNIGNQLAVLNCRKYNLDKELYIVGDNEMAQMLRQSNMRDLHHGEMDDYMVKLMQIVDVKDPMLREKQIDLLRWKWLEDNTFYKVFDIESIIAYMLQVEMIERWVSLDKVQGENTFRQLVSDMKQESVDTLEEFKEKNK